MMDGFFAECILRIQRDRALPRGMGGASGERKETECWFEIPCLCISSPWRFLALPVQHIILHVQGYPVGNYEHGV